MTIDEAKKELEKFVKVKTTQRPVFLDVILNAIEAESVKHGRWIVLHGVLAGDDIYGDMGECSNCGLHLRNYEWDYCPNCGADMREVEE